MARPTPAPDAGEVDAPPVSRGPADSVDGLARALVTRLQAGAAPPCDALSDGALQGLLVALLPVYVAKVRARAEAGLELPAPFPAGADVAATDVVVAVLEMLKAVDVAVFELGMWQALGSY